MTGAPAEVLLTSDVPRVPGPLPDTIVNQETGIQLHNLQLIEGGLSPNSFEHQFINTANVTEHNIRLCQESTVNEFCCNFRIQTVLHDPQVEPVVRILCYYFIHLHDPFYFKESIPLYCGCF